MSDKKEIRTTIVKCQQVKKNVSLAKTFLIISVDEISNAKGVLIDFDCLEKMNCPFVAINKGDNIYLDWKRCPHHPGDK